MTNFYTRTMLILQSALIALLLLSSAYAEAVPEPQKMMEQTSKEMLKAFVGKTQAIRKDPKIAHALINDSLVPKINFSLMSRWVLGKNWKKATVQQQQAFVHEFKDLVIKFYTRALVDYLEKNDISEDIISFSPFRGKVKSKYATVRSQVNPPGGGEAIKVNYDLYFGKSGQWQVYDVSIEGISLVTTYRSSFRQIIKQKGMDALLTELRDKNSKLNNPETSSQAAIEGGTVIGHQFSE
ncbi:MAG: ABC transporter substrate-binding protein [Gammaproteobacteria bacterium]|nr:ABC transporter substrate-binding protein [Gammaproteobacteria bacterium]